MLSDEQQGNPDRSTLTQMLRSAVGPKLDEVHQATLKVKDAVRLHEVAESIGDHQTAELLDQALRSLRAATHQ